MRLLRVETTVVALGLAMVGSMLLEIGAARVAIGDLIVASLILHKSLSRTLRKTDGARATDAPRIRLVAPMAAFTIAGLIGLYDIGIDISTLVSVIRDWAALGWLYVVYLYRHDLTDKVICQLANFAGFLVLVELAILLQERGINRATGTFLEPNYAAHFVTIVGFFCIGLGSSRLLKYATAAAILWSLLLTGSFGGMAMVAVGLPVALAGAIHKSLSPDSRALVNYVLFVSFTLLALVMLSRADIVLADERLSVLGDQLGSNRFDKSGDSRSRIWGESLAQFAERPWGWGPDGLTRRGLLKNSIHNDYVAAVVERGILGLVALLWLLRNTWAAAKVKTDTLIAILLASAVSGAVREVLHFRHMWLMIGLSIYAGWAKSRRSQELESQHIPERAPAV